MASPFARRALMAAVAAVALAGLAACGGGSALPYSVQYQLEHAVAANGGAWKAGDLVIVDAGANDALGLATTYRDARAGSTSSQAIYAALLAQQLSASTIQQALAQPDG